MSTKWISQIDPTRSVLPSKLIRLSSSTPAFLRGVNSLMCKARWKAGAPACLWVAAKDFKHHNGLEFYGDRRARLHTRTQALQWYECACLLAGPSAVCVDDGGGETFAFSTLQRAGCFMQQVSAAPWPSTCSCLGRSYIQ